jgi:hypothetical protein
MDHLGFCWVSNFMDSGQFREIKALCTVVNFLRNHVRKWAIMHDITIHYANIETSANNNNNNNNNNNE